MVPPLQLMCPSNGVQHLLAGLEAKMVCVIETEPTPRALELIGGKAFQGCLGGHGHKDRKIDGAMGQSQDGCAGASCLDRVVTVSLAKVQVPDRD